MDDSISKMADFDPGWLTKRETTLADWRLLHWPRTLALWRGLVQPRFLLLTRPVFPSIVRLPGPRIYPALALQVLRRWDAAATAVLPIFARRIPFGRTGGMPHYDYRLQRLPRRSHFTPPFDRQVEWLDTWAPHPLQTQSPAAIDESAAQNGIAPAELGLQETWWQPAPRQDEPLLQEPFSAFEVWREAWDALREITSPVRPFPNEGASMRVSTTPAAVRPRAVSSQTLSWPHVAEPTFEFGPAESETADMVEEILARHALPALSLATRTDTGVPPGRIFRRPLIALPASSASAASEILPGTLAVAQGEGASEASTQFYLSSIDYQSPASPFPLAEMSDVPQGVLFTRLDLPTAIESFDLGSKPAVPHIESLEVMDGIARSTTGKRESHSETAPRVQAATAQAALQTHSAQAAQSETPPRANAFEFGYVAAPRRRPWRQVTPIETQVLKAWPVLDVIRRLDLPPASTEPAPVQFLRSIPPDQARPAIAAIEALPSLGEGERIDGLVKATMESLVGRDLSNVQVYTSPAAQELGAAAFTTGERIVFAPGRKQFGTREGLALLGHELAHLGQSLGFRPLAETSSWTWDGAEHLAHQQEELVVRHLAQPEHVVESQLAQAWASPPTMQVRYEPTAAAAAQSQTQGAAQVGAGSPRPESAAIAPEMQIASQPGPTTTVQMGEQSGISSTGDRHSGGGTTGAYGSQNLESLARQVYAILKKELRAERDRHQLYSR